MLFQDRLGKNTQEQLVSLAPMILVLAHNFKVQKENEKLRKLKPIIELLPEGQELDTLRVIIPELFE